jgi:hypothetical protein
MENEDETRTGAAFVPHSSFEIRTSSFFSLPLSLEPLPSTIPRWRERLRGRRKRGEAE